LFENLRVLSGVRQALVALSIEGYANQPVSVGNAKDACSILKKTGVIDYIKERGHGLPYVARIRAEKVSSFCEKTLRDIPSAHLVRQVGRILSDVEIRVDCDTRQVLMPAWCERERIIREPQLPEPGEWIGCDSHFRDRQCPAVRASRTAGPNLFETHPFHEEAAYAGSKASEPMVGYEAPPTDPLPCTPLCDTGSNVYVQPSSFMPPLAPGHPMPVAPIPVPAAWHDVAATADELFENDDAVVCDPVVNETIIIDGTTVDTESGTSNSSTPRPSKKPRFCEPTTPIQLRFDAAVPDVCPYHPERLKTFEIFARTLTGKLITLTVASSYSVADLKALICCKTAIPEEQQRLTFRTWGTLEDDRLLSDYWIRPNDWIHLLLRCRGGQAFRQARERQKEFDERNSWNKNSNRSAPLKFFPNSAVDQRWSTTDASGDRVDLASEQSQYDTMCLVTSLLGLEKACKMQRAVMLSVKATDDYAESLRRAAVLESLISIDMSLAKFVELCRGIIGVQNSLGIQTESIQAYLARIDQSANRGYVAAQRGSRWVLKSRVQK